MGSPDQVSSCRSDSTYPVRSAIYSRNGDSVVKLTLLVNRARPRVFSPARTVVWGFVTKCLAGAAMAQAPVRRLLSISTALAALSAPAAPMTPIHACYDCRPNELSEPSTDGAATMSIGSERRKLRSQPRDEG